MMDLALLWNRRIANICLEKLGRLHSDDHYGARGDHLPCCLPLWPLSTFGADHKVTISSHFVHTLFTFCTNVDKTLLYTLCTYIQYPHALYRNMLTMVHSWRNSCAGLRWGDRWLLSHCELFHRFARRFIDIQCKVQKDPTSAVQN